MQTLDMTFFEEFKRLESICNDMFSCKSGVTEYINQMEQTADKGRIVVPGWDADYKALKHLRWLRNQIAHDADVAGLCKQEELTQLRKFYKRILTQQDPLAMLQKAGKPKPTPKPKSEKAVTASREKPVSTEKKKPATTHETKKQTQKPEKHSHVGAIILLVLLILVFLVGLGILYLDVSGSVPLSELWDTIRNLPEKLRG